MNESKETIVVGDLFADNGYGSQAGRIYDGGDCTDIRSFSFLSNQIYFGER